MTAIAEQILESFRSLPPEEQIEVARTIQAELDLEPEFEISEADYFEAERRLEEYRRDPSTAIPLEEFRAQFNTRI